MNGHSESYSEILTWNHRLLAACGRSWSLTRRAVSVS